jgi:transposase-like protein
LTSRKYGDEIKRDLKPIYTAVNAEAARAALDELTDKWGDRYPAVIRLWESAWEEFTDAAGAPYLHSRSWTGGPSGPGVISRPSRPRSSVSTS